MGQGMQKLATFALVGALGFLVDVAVLYLLISSLGAFAARLVSFVCAVLATWLLNRKFTFKERPADLSPLAEFFAYFGLMLGGGALNYGVYAALILIFTQVKQHPVLGVALGSVAGMAFNFMSSHWLLYKDRR